MHKGWPEPGDTMTFLGENGYDLERDEARGKFVVGQEYTVKDIRIGDWSHSIEFTEVPGRYNGVMFSIARDCREPSPSEVQK